jgi:hypothetical protein
MTFKLLLLDVVALVHDLFVPKSEFMAPVDYRVEATPQVGIYAAAYLRREYWTH